MELTDPQYIHLKNTAKSKYNLLAHFKSLKSALLSVNGIAILNHENFEVTVQFENCQFILWPSFFEMTSCHQGYTPDFHEDCVRFNGWRPYQTLSIEAFTDKLFLKKVVKHIGILTPDFSQDPKTTLTHLICKQNLDSYGKNIRGPFKNASEWELKPQEEQYFEVFTPGKIVKAWFWNSKPIVLQIQEMLNVTGDGKRTLQQNIESIPKLLNICCQLDEIKQMLAFSGISLETVLPAGKKQFIDFRYKIDLNPNVISQDILFSDVDNSLKTVFEELGRLLSAISTEHIQYGLAYTVDGIINNDQFWFLEANTNPLIHPALYSAMLQTLYVHHTKKQDAVEKAQNHFFNSY